EAQGDTQADDVPALPLRVRYRLGRDVPANALIHALVISNPAAGRGQARRQGPRVARAFRAQGWTVEVAETDGPLHATHLAGEAAGRGVERVIALGGDGAVHEVANGLQRARSRALIADVTGGCGVALETLWEHG